MALGGNDFHVFDTGALETEGDELGCPLDIRFVLGKRADTGDPQEVFQLFEQAVLVLFYKCVGGSGHGRGYHHYGKPS
jgi:hypothetical protein